MIADACFSLWRRNLLKLFAFVNANLYLFLCFNICAIASSCVWICICVIISTRLWKTRFEFFSRHSHKPLLGPVKLPPTFVVWVSLLPRFYFFLNLAPFWAPPGSHAGPHTGLCKCAQNPSNLALDFWKPREFISSFYIFFPSSSDPFPLLQKKTPSWKPLATFNLLAGLALCYREMPLNLRQPCLLEKSRRSNPDPGFPPVYFWTVEASFGCRCTFPGSEFIDPKYLLCF